MDISRFEYIRHYDRYLHDMIDDAQAWPYIHQVYDYLEMMPANTVINLQATEQKLPWLLVTVGAFLAAGDHWTDHELNDDYTKLRKKFIPPDLKLRMRGLHPAPK